MKQTMKKKYSIDVQSIRKKFPLHIKSEEIKNTPQQ